MPASSALSNAGSSALDHVDRRYPLSTTTSFAFIPCLPFSRVTRRLPIAFLLFQSRLKSPIVVSLSLSLRLVPAHASYRIPRPRLRLRPTISIVRPPVSCHGTRTYWKSSHLSSFLPFARSSASRGNLSRSDGRLHTPPPQSSQSAPPPPDTQRTPPPQNTQSATPPNADASNTDSLVTAADAAARAATLIGTKDGPIANQTGASLISKAKVKFLSNKAWSLTTSDGKALEFTVTLTPRSTWAFNNGPGGNFTQIAWKTSDKLVNGIEITPNANTGQSEDSWTKLTRSGSEIGVTWSVQWYESSSLFFKNSFLYPRLAEYAVSGRPVQWDTTIEIHDAIDKCWEVRIFACEFALKLVDISKKKNTNGPTASMFLSGRRPVFVSNATTMDEGRASEYEEKFKLLRFFGDSDLRYNRVPEVVVYNSVTKKFTPISFHHIHRLGQGLVMNMTVAPMAFSHSKQLSWDYRLVNITILGRHADDSLASPTKYVVKRKIIDLSLDSSDEEKQPSPKKPSASKGKTSADAKSVAQAA
ncbi:hypothetical protein B0H14DRAFT_3519161 [Mycena olivaceomarginata]|nr:hypothetical protein B0H14DRAFT_3519161 [Mycena olivaceomarginata]